ncbi:MAG: 50S ribosomal protein L13 [Candidatus Koribacter versatilis]|uniref:Large ribosomal subunit protein uL13 n=1 Tax=Candidatus Korobacter versatilis TaxID=658062 RepID=A0A932A8G3_9BACT|nr:50S ribosomal protein L13 [Candidatus Koribacter versatilis]
MSTYFPKGEIARSWYVVDADGQTLGRMAARVARLLSGKDSPQYTPFLDTGSHVVIINAAKVRVTGMKAEQKKYHRYTGFPGGLRTEEFKKRFERAPERLIEDTITGMLPHTKLGRQMATKLKVYRGDKHPHQAQQPQALEIARKSSPKSAHDRGAKRA